MKNYIKHDEWAIVEEGFHKEFNLISESIFSIGNGRFGQRANFEEQYTGESLQGNYVAGIYYPDKTRVGWWKNGYPEYFAKVLNSVNWIGILISIDGVELDLNTCEIHSFRRELNMKEGFLMRSFTVTMPNTKKLSVNCKRFCSIVDNELAAIQYSIRPLNFSGQASIELSLDFDVKNKDSNYDEKFWEEGEILNEQEKILISAQTKKSNFTVCAGMSYEVSQQSKSLNPSKHDVSRHNYVAQRIEIDLIKDQELSIYKYVSISSTLNYEKQDLMTAIKSNLDWAKQKGFELMLKEQAQAWGNKWSESDIVIDGDVAAQQGIRFNIFQMNQTYTGEDAHLNIGPKGFTGEKYGGSTYWDTEAFCLPFYLSTSDQEVAKNLLMYRYKQLKKAIENAQKLGFKEGAALYPMVTINGEECHNEWEITFEEIHRNGAIAYAIYEYTNYTGDDSYLMENGLEVLIGISRFWSQRIHFSQDKNKYVMLGVTGPNEYENNINNNWYTNTIAIWTLKYTIKSLESTKKTKPESYNLIVAKTKLKLDEELERWSDIIDKMYYPFDSKRNIFLQQDGFLDKEIKPVTSLNKDELPLHQHWSWDRILRSCYIKQADVLQGIYLFEERYDMDTIRRNFEFYEPITVHESSLSPCVHAILAAKLDMQEKAYEMYLRTSRLDLDDYNNDTEDGCHITSMAGTWMAVVKGFGGMRIENDRLHFRPFLPEQWDGYSFRIRFRKQIIGLKIEKKQVQLFNHSDSTIELFLFDKSYQLDPYGRQLISFTRSSN